jgi:hypothetical protein
MRKALSSVLALPRERTFAMISDRFRLLKLSTEFGFQPLKNRLLLILARPPDLGE